MYEMAQLTQELQVFTSKKGINPIKNAMPMFIQFPVFMSFFFGLRGNHLRHSVGQAFIRHPVSCRDGKLSRGEFDDRRSSLVRESHHR